VSAAEIEPLDATELANIIERIASLASAENLDLPIRDVAPDIIWDVNQLIREIDRLKALPAQQKTKLILNPSKEH
jgi:hypothetical protein